MSFCPRCYGSGRVYDGARPGSSPCPRCEPESAEADGAPTCRICGRVVIRHPGVLRRAFAATPTPTVTAAAEALGTTRRWLRAEAAAVGYELPAPRPGPRARGPV